MTSVNIEVRGGSGIRPRRVGDEVIADLLAGKDDRIRAVVGQGCWSLGVYMISEVLTSTGTWRQEMEEG